MEDNLNKKLHGLKNDFEYKWDNLQDSIENLIDQQQCPPEEECQSDTMVEKQCQQQPQQRLKRILLNCLKGCLNPQIHVLLFFQWRRNKKSFPL